MGFRIAHLAFSISGSECQWGVPLGRVPRLDGLSTLGITVYY